MKTCSVVLLVWLVCNCGLYAERPAYYLTFAEGADYPRMLRTAFSARGWERVARADATGGNLLQVRLRFDEPGSNGLLVVDIPPTRLNAFDLRIRNPEANPSPVNVHVTFGLAQGAAVFRGIELEPGSAWIRHSGDIARQLQRGVWKGKAIPPEPFLAHTGDAPVVKAIYVDFRLPSEASANLQKEIIMEVDLLEAFSR